MIALAVVLTIGILAALTHFAIKGWKASNKEALERHEKAKKAEQEAAEARHRGLVKSIAQELKRGDLMNQIERECRMVVKEELRYMSERMDSFSKERSDTRAQLKDIRKALEIYR